LQFGGIGTKFRIRQRGSFRWTAGSLPRAKIENPSNGATIVGSNAERSFKTMVSVRKNHLPQTSSARRNKTQSTVNELGLDRIFKAHPGTGYGPANSLVFRDHPPRITVGLGKRGGFAARLPSRFWGGNQLLFKTEWASEWTQSPHADLIIRDSRAETVSPSIPTHVLCPTSRESNMITDKM